MADSIREQILQHVTAALDADHALKPAGTTVHRWRSIPLWEDDLPAVLPYWTQETVEEEDHGVGALRVLRLRLEHRASAAGPTPTHPREVPDQVLDAALTWSTVVMMADLTLGGLAVELREVGTGIDTLEASKTFVGAGQDWEVRYWTDAADPTQGG